MYGLLLENLAEYVKTNYGEDKWEDIRRQAGIDSPSFSVHQVYPENLLQKLAKKAQQILGVSEHEFMDQMGVCFVSFVSQYGYDRVLSVLGRHMRDFLNGLDNLHEYLKFSYPRMKAPSFICENETKQGLTLHYRSKRRGFVYYTMGQIREVARHFYNKEMHIELVREEILFDTVHVTFQLTFDNRAFTLASLAMTREEKHLPISASVLFEIFPFCIVFGSDMTVRSIGNSLMVILPDLVGKKITNWFDLVRPMIAFKFQTILNRTNNIFELVTVDSVSQDHLSSENKLELIIKEEEVEEDKNLRLKGQMIYMDNWRMLMFLGTPVMPDLTSLINTGLYINDLSMHDFSRDLMLAGTQQSVELKLALDQEQQKSKKLEESMRKLDDEMRRTDELLYQMIPKQVADRLRRGENPIDTCEMFDNVSILFSDVVTFTEICSRITPMEVVSMLNGMYSIFDNLTERNRVYKVETIGDAYMVVSGAPEKDMNHAEKVCDMALDMVEAITDLKDPSTGTHLRIRVGVHSGAVVAGIVGLKMPRYCLFGDSVNTASRMESTSTAMKIHISETTKELLSENYKLSERGEIEVKGKGTMKTYWLEDREYRSKLIMPAIKQQVESQVVAIVPSADRKASFQDKRHSKSIGSSRQGSANVATTSAASAEDRRIYSPVTFDDVAMKSITNSPVRSLYSATRGRDSRSNSTGHVFMYTPSDLFGSLVSDTEHLFDELQSHRSLDRNIHGSPTPSISLSPTPDFLGRSLRNEQVENKHTEKASNSNEVKRKPTVEPTKSNIESNKPISRSAKKALITAKQSKTFEQLDQMMEDILEHDIPGMCTFNFGISPKIPVSSQSDGNIAMRSNELSFRLYLSNSGLCANLSVRGENDDPNDKGNHVFKRQQVGILVGNNKKINFLSADTFDKFVNVQTLHLVNCNLSTISYRHFKPLTRLKHVDLGNNKLRKLPRRLFKECESLVDISLTTNNLLEIDETAFEGLQNLKRLNLRNNFLTELHPNTFKWLRHLENLDLEDNNFFTIDGLLLRNLPHLNKLELKGNKIVRLHPDAFKHLKQLKYLDLENNNLKMIHPQIFHNTTALEHLNLSFNEITKIHPLAFSRLAHIQILWLNDNDGITMLPNELFRHQKKLSELYLQSNKIFQIHQGAFKGLDAIKTLNLSQNSLTILPENVFLKTSTLKLLNLSENSIQTLHAKQFRALLYLEELNISSNSLDEIKAETFDITTSLKILNLSNNKIKKIHCESFKYLDQLTYLNLNSNLLPELPEELFRNMKNVETLLLSRNLIKKIQQQLFKAFKQLKILKLNNNQISDIDDEAFDFLVELKELMLQVNRIKDIAHKFAFLYKLEKLNLEHNLLESLEASTFRNMTQLKYMNVSNNYIKYIDEGLKHVLPTMKQLDALNNICVNQTFRNLEFLKKFRVTYSYRKDAKFGGSCEISVGSDDVINTTDTIEEENVKYLYIESSQAVQTNEPNNQLSQTNGHAIQTNGRASERNGHAKQENGVQVQSQLRNPNEISRPITELCRSVESSKLHESNRTSEPEELKLPNEENRVKNGCQITEENEPIQRYLFRTIPLDVIQKFVNLVNMNLQHAGLVEVSSDVFGYFPKLLLVDLSNNRLKKLPSKLFEKSHSLKTVLIENNEIAEIDKNAFDGLGKLTKLSLMKNKIKDLHWETFWPLKQLKYLSLEDNNIFVIGEILFEHQTSLVELNLSSNNIFDIHPHAMKNLSCLAILNLESNKLITLSSLVFQNLSMLTTLDLSNNQLKTLTHEYFDSVGSLKILNLKNNQMTEKQAALFQRFSEIIRERWLAKLMEKK